ncbi:hypothetical protein AB1303_01470 [Saccharolobus solfataricus]|uniref:Uncharacterized protein n=1 Tax=Saccharolobus solfataricus TaxID=2287 RepID=A0A157T224_SACSO|nr:hypothetical protein [Saccharolobus solfataricus]SAI84948.1 uncharacterised protein [Saccharolobus solfataricus]
MYKSIVLILLVLFPLMLSGVSNSSSTTPPFSYFITANWKTIPTLDNLTTINVNLITFLNSTKINAYALIAKILLPQGILNATEGHYVEDILPLSSQVQQYNIQFNITIVSSSLPNQLDFPVMLSLITENGGNVSYNTSFTLPYYGIYNFSIKLLNSSLIQGFQEVIFRINTPSPLYNGSILSPYFMKNVSLSYVNGSKDISVELFVPFEDIPIYHLNIPLTIRFLTPYNLYYVRQLVLETNVNTSISTLYANVRTPNGVVYPGYNNFNVSIVNKDTLPISNLTIIANYNNTMKMLTIPHLASNSAVNFILSFYANSNVSLKIYAFFYTPLGLKNVTLGSYYFPIVYPISVAWNNGNINISNRDNITLYNITVQFGQDAVKILKLSPKGNVLYPATIKPNLVHITFYSGNSVFSYWQKVYEVPFVRLNATYQFINITRSTTGTYTATLILYIQNTGNQNANNIYILIKPNGTAITPPFYVISQILPNETIAIPFTLRTPNSALVQITMFYYYSNQSYTSNITIPLNYTKSVLPISVRLNATYQFINITRSTTGTYTATLILYIQNTGNQNANNIYILIKPNGTAITPPFYVISQILPNETIAMPFTIHVTKNTVFQISMFYYYSNQTYVKNITIPLNYVKLTPGETVVNYLVNYVGKYTLYQVYGIPAIVIAFILIIILISIIPTVKKNTAKE